MPQPLLKTVYDEVRSAKQRASEQHAETHVNTDGLQATLLYQQHTALFQVIKVNTSGRNGPFIRLRNARRHTSTSVEVRRKGDLCLKACCQACRRLWGDFTNGKTTCCQTLPQQIQQLAEGSLFSLRKRCFFSGSHSESAIAPRGALFHRRPLPQLQGLQVDLQIRQLPLQSLDKDKRSFILFVTIKVSVGGPVDV